MKYKLIEEPNLKYNAIQQILHNRGIKDEDFEKYLYTTDKDINNAEMLGEDNLKAAVIKLVKTIQKNGKIFVVVDSDCDGYTSAALLLNYLYDLFPTFVMNNIKYFIHEGKQHGLGDCIDIAKEYDLIICPDSSSNDYEYHKQLFDLNIPVIVLDHHEAEKISEYAIIINNQLSDFPNKDFSGVGITWEFCRYIDKLMNTSFSNDYLDLVALGNCGDMMSLTSIETKHLMNKGFQQVKNPFFFYMSEKNSFSLGTKLTSMGVAFYIVPFINAMQRSGTFEEKELLFKSMLKYEAFKEIPSTKRGYKGQYEKLVEQAVRTAANVKNRQTREQDSCMALLEQMISDKELLNHKVLLFLIEPGQIDKNIAGLCANKIMAKYQRPAAILTKVDDTYQGSARGCDRVGVTDFKDICVNTGVTILAEGHQGAFGLGIGANDINTFIHETDKSLADMTDEAMYYVDYIYQGKETSAQDILNIASLDNLWGKDMDESYIAIENLTIDKHMITLMSPDKKPTLKISLPNGVSIIKFGSSQEEYDMLYNNAPVTIDLVGKCNCNEWNGNKYPQVLCEEYQIKSFNKYMF